MHTLLEKNPASVNEQNAYLQTPLHLAVSWPSGARALLAAGADPNRKDYEGLTPLYYAEQYKHLETVLLLCDYDACILSAGMNYPLGVFRIVVQALADRRERLRFLAIQHLDSEILAVLAPSDDRILDCAALPIHEALVRKGVSVPPALEVTCDGTQYDQPSSIWTEAHADFLFKQGFRDIDQIEWAETDWRQSASTSRTHSQRISLWRWFVETGLDLGRVSSGVITSYYGLQALLQMHFRRWPERSLSQENPSNRQGCATLLRELFELVQYHGPGTLQLIAAHEDRDLCRCHCAQGGCSTISLMIKILQLELGSHASCDLIAEALQSTFDFEENGRRQRDFVSAFIRYEAFLKLQLRHVCCCFKSSFSEWFVPRWPYDETETDEIIEEEHDLIMDLESIVEHLETKYIEVGGPLANFMRGYMASYMAEYFERKSVQDLEERQRIIDLGVILDN